MRRPVRFVVLLPTMASLPAGAAAPPGGRYPRTASAANAALPGVNPAEAPAAGAVLDTLVVEAFELGFAPKEMEVPAPGRYAIELRNTGGIEHDITFPGGEV